MQRRTFIHLGAAIGGTGALSITTSATGTRKRIDNSSRFAQSRYATNDTPRYADWVPSEHHTDPDEDVFFTHVDWDAIDELDDDETPEDEDDELEAVIERVPIIGLPMYGAIITPFAVFGLLFYPFAEHVLPDEEQLVDGIETSTMTWTNDLVIFHGEFSRDVFETEYTDGFTATEEQNDFTVYSGDDVFTEGLSFALSEDTLVAGMMPGAEDVYSPEEIVTEALERFDTETDRIVDDEDGEWLFETTGEGQMVFGGWQLDDLAEAIDPDEELEEDGETLETDPDVEGNPVYDAVESFVNTIEFSVDDGEMGDIEARFSGLYPSDSVPSEAEVAEYLIGEPTVPHEIDIAENRVHASTTFDAIDE